MIVSEIAIYKIADGSIVVLAPTATPLREGQAAVALPADFDEEVYQWSASAKAMVLSLPKLKKRLIAKVKADAEALKMENATTGGFKKTEYAEKGSEVRFFDSLGGTLAAILAAIVTMPATRKASTFPWAVADAAEHGDTLQAAIERFRGGMMKGARNQRIGAREQRLTRDINAATTAAAATKIVADMIWPA